MNTIERFTISQSKQLMTVYYIYHTIFCESQKLLHMYVP